MTSSNRIDGTTTGAIAQARTIRGNITIASPPRPVPAELPPVPVHFADRRYELQRLTKLVHPSGTPGAPAVVIIEGKGGVGKTALALRAAQRIRHHYPAGQLFVDLRGSTPSPARPAHPGIVLERLLRSVGAGPQDLGGDVDELAAHWRSWTSDRRMLILLDNASSVDQVRPLLPAAETSLVLVTTRRPLSDLVLDGARRLLLNALDEPGALELLRNLLGEDRLRGEYWSIRPLLDRCGRIPLPLRTAAAQLASQPGMPIAAFLADFDFVSPPPGPDGTMRRNLDLAYTTLPNDARDLFRLLSVFPGQNVTPLTAGALTGTDRAEARRLLTAIATAGLLEHHDHRYRLLDDVRAYAHDRATEQDTPEALHAAFTRVLTRYLDVTVAAQLTLIPGRWYNDDRFRRPAYAFADTAEARAWYDTEQDNLLTLATEAEQQQIHDDLLPVFTEACWGHFVYAKPYTWWREICRLGHAAAVRTGDLRMQARALEGIAITHLNLREYPAAEEHYATALDLEIRAGHLAGAASAKEGLGLCHLRTGRPERALRAFTESRDDHVHLGDQRGATLQERHACEALVALDRHHEAIERLQRIIDQHHEQGEPYLQGRARVPLATAYRETGQLDLAADQLQQALETFIDLRNRPQQAEVHRELAALDAARGDRPSERRHLTAALEIYTELGAPEAEETRARLAPTTPPAGT
ncbi:tetratricopeptide repeat protein [Actinoallomurus sp. NPDC052274]|uniref:tetratricopeptide repeat protein n=1 Tax=Actinoallomurus sp. NPDC052274 TaxID=3155420 RepID=UPI0034370097